MTKLFYISSILLSGLAVFGIVSSVQASNNMSFVGTVEQVWEDGFRLNTGDRTIKIDSWETCRDSTARSISTGDQVRVAGEFERGEFDVFSITNTDGVAVCRR